MSWLDKPDADGLWWVQNNTGEIWLAHHWQGEFRDLQLVDGRVGTGLSSFQLGKGYKFHRVTLTKPEPYQPPTPPKVEQYTATYEGQQCFLTCVSGMCVITIAATGKVFGSVSSLWAFDTFSDIKPLESPP